MRSRTSGVGDAGGRGDRRGARAARVRGGASGRGRVRGARAAGFARRACAGRPGQGAAGVDRRRRDGVRPAGGRRRVLELRQSRDLRPAVPLRLPGAAVQADAQHRAGAAGNLRRRPDLDDAGPARHLLRRRPGVQGAAARAGRRRLRLRDQAHSRSEAPLEPADRRRRPLRRRRRRRGQGARDRQVRLRRADRRAAGHRPLHAALQAGVSRLRADGQPDDDRGWRPSRARSSRRTATRRAG